MGKSGKYVREYTSESMSELGERKNQKKRGSILVRKKSLCKWITTWKITVDPRNYNIQCCKSVKKKNNKREVGDEIKEAGLDNEGVEISSNRPVVFKRNIDFQTPPIGSK